MEHQDGAISTCVLCGYPTDGYSLAVRLPGGRSVHFDCMFPPEEVEDEPEEED